MLVSPAGQNVIFLSERGEAILDQRNLTFRDTAPVAVDALGASCRGFTRQLHMATSPSTGAPHSGQVVLYTSTGRLPMAPGALLADDSAPSARGPSPAAGGLDFVTFCTVDAECDDDSVCTVDSCYADRSVPEHPHRV